MHQNRRPHAFRLFHHLDEQRQIMPVDWTQIGKAQFLEKHPGNQQILHAVFHPLRRIRHTVADGWNPAQKKLNIVFRPGICGCQSHFRQIMRNGADIFADGHLIVV